MASSSSSSSSSSSFIMKLFFFFAVVLSHGVVELQASHHIYDQTLQTLESNKASSKKSDPYRTAYHFQPPKNWMNDPNGPMIYKGIYHLFYQYNPKGVVWGNIVWAHSTSKDLVNWTPHKPAIYPSQPGDINGTWSGSTTFLSNGSPAILYTGITSENQQVQNLALPKDPSDPYLLDWVKEPKNPLMVPNAQNQINSSSFRDPTTAWLGLDGKWRVIIGSKINRRGLAILYKSDDFVNWVQANYPIHYSDETGMWECPDFFPVSVTGKKGMDLKIPKAGGKVKYVLKYSLDDTKHDYYTIGDYDHVKDVYSPNKGLVDGEFALRYDYGKYYASKTFFDSATSRRILWGWANESSSVSDDVKKGWSGIQAIPREIWLDKSGKQLIQWPIKEIEKLRTKPVHLPKKVLKKGSQLPVSGVTAAQADVEISFKVSNLEKAEILDPRWTLYPHILCSQKGGAVKGSIGPFGLLVLASKGMEEYTSVFFRIFKAQSKYVVLMCSDQTRSSLNPDNDKTTYGAFVDIDPVHDQISLRSLIDHSVVESFGGNGKSSILTRVYPKMAVNEAAHLFAFNNGTQSVTITRFSAWSMNKAHIN